MASIRLGLAVLLCVALTAGTALLTARGQQPRPGEIGENRVLVENHRPEQAIPVVVQKDLEVKVRVVRQTWEYRTLTASAADPSRLLATAGLEGWEAVGFQSSSGGWTLLLKRPR